MKLRALDTRPPQTVRVSLDGATHDKLIAYLAYAAEQGQVFTDVKQLLTEIARAFVDSGDKGFTAWYRAGHGTATVLASPVNGHRGQRQSQVPQEAAPPKGAVKAALE
jgi:hypothetical protein